MVRASETGRVWFPDLVLSSEGPKISRPVSRYRPPCGVHVSNIDAVAPKLQDLHAGDYELAVSLASADFEKVSACDFHHGRAIVFE